MLEKLINPTVAVIGIDIGKNSFHVVGLDQRGAIDLRRKWSRSQVQTRLPNMPPCLVGMEMEACVGDSGIARDPAEELRRVADEADTVDSTCTLIG